MLRFILVYRVYIPNFKSKLYVLNGSYNNLHFEEFGRDLALFDRWFQTMTRKMGSHHYKKLKFSTNVSNREMRKVRKFQKSY